MNHFQVTVFIENENLGLQELLLDLTDFSIETSDGIKMKVHKHILASRLPGLQKVLNMKSENGDATLKLADLDSKVATEVLRFIYCNTVFNLDELACSIIFAAHKYEIEDLMDLCTNSLISNLSTSNFLRTVVISNELNISKLFESCLDLFTR